MTINLKSMTRVVSWLMALALSFTFALPVEAIEFFPTPFRFEWSAQSGTISADGTVYEYTVKAGDTVSMSLSVTNRSTDQRALVMYGIPPGGNLLPEVEPYRGAHELRIGVENDEILPWLDSSSFIENLDGDNNRLAVYDGANVHNGSDVVFNWDVTIASDAADGVYEMTVSMVREFDAWATNIDGGDIFWRFNIGDTSYVPPAQTGALTISSSSLTPASTQVATGGNANFTRFTLTAAAGTTVNITSIYVTRGGLSTDSEVENIKLLDANMVQRGNTAGGFNAIHQAQLFFSPALAITGSMDFIVRAGFISTATSTHTAKLGVNAATDIVSDATSVSGPPVYGNLMTVIDVTLGTITLWEDGGITDTTPDVGDINVPVNAFKLEGGTTEDIIIEQITVNKAGSADSSDTTNIELWDVTNNVSLGEVTSWSADDKAVFPVNITLAQGKVLRYKIQLDIIDGSGLTVNADIVDGSDVLVFAKGALYGYYITPTSVAGSHWTLDSGTGGTNNHGQGDKNQTINAGSLIISKSADTAPTGNIAQASDQVLGTWNFEARGEPVRISALSITLSGTAASDDTEKVENFKSVKLYDATGTIVAGPVNGSAATGALDRAIDFTQTFIVPVGIHPYTLKASIQTGADDTETVIAAITAAGDITAKTIRTNTSITATGPPSTLNTQTVKAGVLASTVLSTPVSRSIVPGTANMIWMTGMYDATNSGEDILITAQQFSLATGTSADVDHLLGITIWADLDSNGSYETQLSSPETNSGNTLADDIDDTITYDVQTLTVPKGTSVNVAYKASLSASATTATGATFIISFDGDSSDVTASGKDTGTEITTAPTGTGPTWTVTAKGALTPTVDASSPLITLFVGNSSMVHTTTWRFAADNVEDIRIDKILVNETNSAELDVTTKVYLYANRDNTGAIVTPYEIASGALTSSGDNTFYLNPNTTMRPVVPADQYMLVYCYVDTAAVDGTLVVNNDAIAMDLESDFTGTGMGSGQTITASVGDLDGAIHKLFKSIPTVTLSPLSPSGNLIPSANSEIAVFRITADAADDITFDDGQSNELKVDIATYVGSTYVESDTSAIWLVNKTDGLTITDSQAVDIGATSSSQTTEVTFTFDTSGNVLTIPAGDYKDIAVMVHTGEFTTAGDSIVVYLDDDADANFKWSVNLGTAVTTGIASFRSDIYGHTLVKAG